MNLRNINLDRRQESRKVPDRFAFLQVEGDDGGTVLDVSERGLRFETFGPVCETGQIHFWFSLNLREQIEAWGEVAWLNAAKKCGGLRFLRLSEEGRAQSGECVRPQGSCRCEHAIPCAAEVGSHRACATRTASLPNATAAHCRLITRHLHFCDYCRRGDQVFELSLPKQELGKRAGVGTRKRGSVIAGGADQANYCRQCLCRYLRERHSEKESNWGPPAKHTADGNRRAP